MEITKFDEPYPHWLIDGFLDQDLYRFIPPAGWDGWEARYDNDCERGKRTARRLLPYPLQEALAKLNSFETLSLVREITEMRDLVVDHTYHGAGLHVTDPGGHLNQHLDYALHPVLTTMERRANLIVFLNPHWSAEWGGAFECGNNVGTVVKRIPPAPGRAILWLPSDTAFHGTERVTDDAEPRATLAAYYLMPARPGVVRRRALFIPNRS
jgi:Rps23 Pro-64 3,4-dihydroxylase Tpa1-like proline 4-hydroxylase